MSHFTEHERIISLLKDEGQEHVLTQVPEILVQRNPLHPIVAQLSKINLENSCRYFRSSTLLNDITEKKFIPLHDVVNLSSLPKEIKHSTAAVGLENVRNEKVAAIILSGGQGTRLGFSGPKGMFDKLGLISGKTIFQLHIEKIMKVRAMSIGSNGQLPRVPVFIMTSDLNHNIIREFFHEKDYFGYPRADIIFFEQGVEPCFTFDGKIIIESPTKLSVAPDGNGGIYNALKNSGSIEVMLQRGIEYLHIYGIDNVLTKSLDPLFLGLCIEKGVKCGNKVVWRAHKSEKVGVTVQSDVDGKMHVIEYSEIPADMRDAVDSHERLLFGAANICSHFMTVGFLVHDVLPHLDSNYHSAVKKIPFMDPVTKETITPTQSNGVKLEMFIFDVFPLAERSWLVVEGEREDEFAPVKNEPGNPQDSPDTALRAISMQGKRWLETAGAIIQGEGICEISSLVSYGGEGLEIYRGQIVALPALLN